MTPSFPSAFNCPDCDKPLVIKTSNTKKPLICTDCGKRFTIQEAEIKKLNIHYPDNCPRARRIDEIVNFGGGTKEKIEKCLLVFSRDEFLEFIFACLLCWSRAQHWDERNRMAVFASRRMLEHIPNIALCIHDESLLRDATYLTTEFHREVQNLFFRAAFDFLKQEGIFGLIEWYESQNFVYTNDYKSLIPRSELNQYSI